MLINQLRLPKHMLMKQILLVMGAVIITSAPMVVQAQDSTKSVPAATATTAPSKLVTGRVTDEKGKPLEDVTVQLKGSRTSTKTNSSGSYSLNVPENGVLVFSFVGMGKQELPVTGKTSVDLQMKPFVESSLEDVIVVGYGTQKSKDVTGAIVSLDLKKVQDIPVLTVAEALRGQTPNVNISGGSTRPGSTPTISIRQQFGLSKDGSSPLPLIVIDDVIQINPLNGQPSMDQFNLLDLSEVESVTVLKDASAAIYGSRAAQGAIVIRTKRGKNQAPKIAYSGKFEQMDAVGHPKTLSAYEYGVFSNRYGRANTSVWNKPEFFFTDDELEQMKSLDYDWRRDAWKKAFSAQHSLNVSGGTDRATYFAGASYGTQGANMGEQDYKRWTFRSGTDIKVANNLKLSATIGANNFSVLNSFTKVSVNGGYVSGQEQNDYAILAHMPKYIPWMVNVNGVDQYVGPTQGPRFTGPASVGNINTITGWNYFALLNNGSNTNSKNLAYNTNFSLQYDVPFVKGLSIRGAYGLTYSTDNTEQVMLPQHLAIASNKNALNAHLYTATTDYATGVNSQGSRVSYIDVIGKVQQSNFYVNYDRSFGLHNISAMGAIEKAQQDYQRKFLLYESPLDGGYNGSSSSAGTLSVSNSAVNRSQGGALSYLGRISYNYDSKYLVQFVARTDASTKFAPENYWGFFPSLSAGWVMSSENWFRNNVSWVNNLKVRASIGLTGNDNIAYWRWAQFLTYASDKGMVFGSNGGALTAGLTPNPTPNRDVTWNKTTKKNIGVDFSVLKSRLSGSVDYYHDAIRDMLTAMSGQVGTPVSVGGAFAEQNFAGFNASGIELSLNWRDQIGKDFSYGIGMNFARNYSSVVKYFPVAFNYPSTNPLIEGQSTVFPAWGFNTWKGTSTGDGLLRTDADLDNYWNYLTDLATKAGTTPAYFTTTTRAGMAKGMLAYEDQAGNLDANNKTIAGQNGRIAVNEDYTKLAKANSSYGVVTNLSASWKGISFAAQISTSWGGNTMVDALSVSTSSNQMFWNKESYLKDMFDPTDNPNGKYANLGFSNNSSPSDFWKLPSFRCFVRTLSVGYSIPKNWAKTAHLESARVFLSGNNLWDFYNPYPDKYRTMYDSPNSGYPTLRTWALGVNVGF